MYIHFRLASHAFVSKRISLHPSNTNELELPRRPHVFPIVNDFPDAQQTVVNMNISVAWLIVHSFIVAPPPILF